LKTHLTRIFTVRLWGALHIHQELKGCYPYCNRPGELLQNPEMSDWRCCQGGVV